jgi:hypothetical protein
MLTRLHALIPVAFGLVLLLTPGTTLAVTLSPGDVIVGNRELAGNPAAPAIVALAPLTGRQTTVSNLSSPVGIAIVSGPEPNPVPSISSGGLALLAGLLLASVG